MSQPNQPNGQGDSWYQEDSGQQAKKFPLGNMADPNQADARPDDQREHNASPFNAQAGQNPFSNASGPNPFAPPVQRESNPQQGTTPSPYSGHAEPQGDASAQAPHQSFANAPGGNEQYGQQQSQPYYTEPNQGTPDQAASAPRHEGAAQQAHSGAPTNQPEVGSAPQQSQPASQPGQSQPGQAASGEFRSVPPQQNAGVPGILDPRTGEVMPVADLNQLQDTDALLVVVSGPDAGAQILLDTDVVTVGRSPNADIFLDDVTVSRKHAEFVRTPSGFTLRDTGSLNGTYVGRQLIDSVELQNGADVQIGKFRMIFQQRPRQ